MRHLKLIVGISSCCLSCNALVIPPRVTSIRHVSANPSTSSLKGIFDFLNLSESKIPEELREEIYRAESNTPAAKQRGQRVALFALISLIGIVCAFFNGFLTELRANGPDGTAGVDLNEAGFGWATSNFLFSFIFTNKIGGGICLLGGAGAGLLAEIELDSKRVNAEKIYEELERRRNAKVKPSKKISEKKKRRSGKEMKRLSALSEVVVEENQNIEEGETSEDEMTSKSGDIPKASEESADKGGGLFGGIKDLYNKADTMAASQALLLNKQLEDAGIVEKITDESGLKVIGKEAAEKLKTKAGDTADDGKEPN